MKKKPLRYRMDNSATIYPMVVTKTSQSLFALGAELDAPVDKELFLRAIELAFDRFPLFKVHIRYGFFRPYFEENTKPYLLMERRNFLLEPISFPHNNGYAFGTEIHNNRVYMIFFHALCDANGAIEFLKTVLHAYLTLTGKEIEGKGIRVYSESPKKEEEEDAFERYYKKFPLVSGAKNMAGGFAFGVTSKHLDNGRFDSNIVRCKTADLLETAHAHNCTVTAFLTALLARSVFLSHDREPRKHNYDFFVPVNYRKYFPSETRRDFTGFARGTILPETDFDIENLIRVIREEMSKQLTKTELHKKLSFSSLMSKNALMKIMPYWLKRRISLWGRGVGGRPRQTMIVSNLGRVDFPADKGVERLKFFVNVNARTPENVGILSFGDVTEISFTRKIESDKTEKTFCELLGSFIPCTLAHEYFDE